MSFYVSGLAWKTDVPAATKLVLLALADTADDDGKCWPGRKTLMKKCGMSERSVDSHIKRLCDSGLLQKQIQRRENGSYTSSLYRITLQKNPAPPGADIAPPPADIAPGGAESAPLEPVIEPIIEPKKKNLCASANARREDFDKFWEAFGYKKGKEPAWRAWRKITKYSPELVETILSSAKKESARRPAIEAAGRTPKMAQGWITDKRWEDEEEKSSGTYTTPKSPMDDYEPESVKMMRELRKQKEASNGE